MGFPSSNAYRSQEKKGKKNMKETTSLVLHFTRGIEHGGSLRVKNQLWVREAKNSSVKK